MSKGITARYELFSHLSKLVEKEEAENMINEYKEEIIKEYKENIINGIIGLPANKVTPIRCKDGVTRNRPLIDFADVTAFIREN